MSDRTFFDTDLFESVLLDPARKGLDTLRVVSGYASAAMAAEHLLALHGENLAINLSVVYGMAGLDGVPQSAHQGFLALQGKTEFAYGGQFACAYVRRPAAVHAKLYLWCNGTSPVAAFAGSANYTVNGFLGGDNRREILTRCDPARALAYWEGLADWVVPCALADLKEDFRPKSAMPPSPTLTSTILVETDPKSPFCGCAKVKLPLITRNNDPGNGSCLNWGIYSDGSIRDGGGNSLRDPNQAYIRLESKVYRTGFFPPVGHRFTVLTDDGHIFSCARAQDNGKAIHTPQDNAELGRYFRSRIGVPLGSYITKEALLRYGRTSLTFYKLDDENYVMDFAPKKSR